MESVERAPDGDAFFVRARAANADVEEIVAKNVIVASGIMQTPKYPPLRDQLPAWLTQLHTADYRNPSALPNGAVVVVGGGQSGCQIAEDLLAAGRDVYLCASRVGRLPRRYRGREFLEWWKENGFWDVTREQLEDPAIARAAQPIISGVGRYGHTLSLQQLARDGVTLLGRLEDIDGDRLLLDDKLAEYLAFADNASARFKTDIDDYIARAGLTSPPNDPDPADDPYDGTSITDAPTSLDLRAAGVSTVIWSTGFSTDFSWLHLPVLNEEALPVHERGISDVPGVYFLGFPWLHKRTSGIIRGIEEDAGFIAQNIEARLSAVSTNS